MWTVDINNYELGDHVDDFMRFDETNDTMIDCHNDLVKYYKDGFFHNMGVIELVDRKVVRKYTLLECKRIIKLGKI